MKVVVRTHTKNPIRFEDLESLIYARTDASASITYGAYVWLIDVSLPEEFESEFRTNSESTRRDRDYVWGQWETTVSFRSYLINQKEFVGYFPREKEIPIVVLQSYLQLRKLFPTFTKWLGK